MAGTQPPGAAPPDGGSAEEVLRRGTHHIRSALARAGDLELFRSLHAELSQGALGIAGRKKEGPWTWAGGIGDALSMRSPWRPSVETEQLEDLESTGKQSHARVLRKMSETFGVPPEMWWTNLYDDASIGCDFHRDTLKHDAITVSASFGASRDLVFRHAATGREFPFRQQNGDIFAFDATVDSSFVHGVYPTSDVEGGRISIVAVCRTSAGVQGGPVQKQKHNLLQVRPDGRLAITSEASLREQQEAWMRNCALLYEGCGGPSAAEGGAAPPPQAAPPELYGAGGRSQQTGGSVSQRPASAAVARGAPGASGGSGALVIGIDDKVRGKSARKGRPRLTRAQAAQMEDDLLRGFQDEAFQERLHAAWAAAGASRAAQVRARQELCLPVQAPIIARYGFEPSRRGVLESLAAVRSDFLEDRELMEKASYLSWLVDPALQRAAPHC